MQNRSFAAFAICCVSTFTLLAQQFQGPLTNQRIGDLVIAGVSQNEIERIISSASVVNFDLRPISTDALLKVGVSEDVIKAMSARENGLAVSVTPVAVSARRKESETRPGLIATGPMLKTGSAHTLSILSLSQVRRIYIEKLPNDFDQYLRAEFFKQMPKRVTVVMDKGEADAIVTGVDEHDRRIGSTITGRYLGLHDNTTASISVLDHSESAVLWSDEAGDRSLTFPIMHRNGERKVASRIVSKLKKAMRNK
ncbi:MAG: hypothetical protein ACR2IV_01635 [Bryobacteraceae bacterium]